MGDLESQNKELERLLARLLEQANDASKFSSWSDMCEYYETVDARKEAREYLDNLHAI